MINVAMAHAESNDDLSVVHWLEQIKNTSTGYGPKPSKSLEGFSSGAMHHNGPAYVERQVLTHPIHRGL
jgi:hypothetical protein